MADAEICLHRPVVTRAEGRSAGATHYFTGRLCKHGHLSDRRVPDGHCVECDVAHSIAYRKANPGCGAAWRMANLEKCAAYDVARYAANPERELARSAAWAKANPEVCAAKSRNRRAMLRAAAGTHTKADIQWLMKVQGKRCAHGWCRVGLKAGYHTDHVIPLFLGGDNDRKNLQLLCGPCNQRKHASHPIDFAQRHGMLL